MVFKDKQCKDCGCTYQRWELMEGYDMKKGVWGDPDKLLKLKEKYPDLRGITISAESKDSFMGGLRGSTEYTVYYREIENSPQILLIDEQQGNYAGGTVWLEGRAQSTALKWIGHINSVLVKKLNAS